MVRFFRTVALAGLAPFQLSVWTLPIALSAVPSSSCRGYQFAQESTQICLIPSLAVFASEICLKNPKCGALQLIQRCKTHPPSPAIFTTISPHRSRNPGSVLCDFFEGTPEIGISETGDSSCFCQVNDQTRVSCSDLALIRGTDR